MSSSITSAKIPVAAGTTNKITPKTSKNLQALRKSCRDFEAIYTQEMYKAMRKTVPDGGIFDNKNMANGLYKEMLDMEIAKIAAAGKGNGIGEAMYQQMKGKIENKK
ncbi:MAG: rod-binding protein [Desulfocapsaceae bacterium]|jgi:flagellar protein FlgJ|nr:rod-binding protein [Desulfocapsaceae bacterium]